VQFIAKIEKPLQVGLILSKGVDLSNIEFHNVEWTENKGPHFHNQRHNC
jgi:hypothetical protein